MSWKEYQRKTTLANQSTEQAKPKSKWAALLGKTSTESAQLTLNRKQHLADFAGDDASPRLFIRKVSIAVKF